MPRTVTKEPGPAEWKDKRDLITELYSSPYLTLDDVISIMASENGFTATKRMFRKYLRIWGLSKTVAIDKRHELVQIAIARLRVGRDLPLVDSEGYTIPWARVKKSSLRKGEHLAVWRYIQIPHAQNSLSHHPTKSQSNTRQDATMLSSQQSRDQDSLSSRSNSTSTSGTDPPKNLFSRYRPRSPVREIDKILFCISDFQNWRAIAVPHGSMSYEASNPGDDAAATSIIVGNAAREDAALNVSNSLINVYQHLVLEQWDAAGECMNSVLQYFDSYLTEPSLFLLYSVISSHVMTTAQRDKVVLAHETKLLMKFRELCSTRLSQSHPLTEVLGQLIACPGSVLSDWSIAILDCLAHTKDHLTSEAARFTSLKMKHGLVWALLGRGYHFSAITILEDIIAQTSTFTHPVLRKTSWLRSKLAEIYRGQGWVNEARAALEEAFVLAQGTIDDGLLHCSSLLGQIQESSGQIENAEQTYRLLYESSCQIHGKTGSSTMLYARLYFDFLRRNNLDVLKDWFKEEFISVEEVDLKLLQRHQWEVYAKYITLKDSGYT